MGGTGNLAAASEEEKSTALADLGIVPLVRPLQTYTYYGSELSCVSTIAPACGILILFRWRDISA